MNLITVGAWLSLVERLVRDQEVGGSNPLAPIFFERFLVYNVPVRGGIVNSIHDLINSVSLVLNLIGAGIVVWGILLSTLDFLGKELFNRRKLLELNEIIRLKLGSYLVLSLEFFIASDIVRTVITPTWESLGMLGAIVVIRTVLSYFLAKDISKK